ncbi:MAG: hypothetical protein GC181_13235 [Bacteroidetes bacterium]|nr:hypothetical protein [Bacteroidota bacterium]
MKIRIQGDTIRLRLSQTEVDRIGSGKSVEELTHFNDGTFSYELKTHETGEEITTGFQKGNMKISLRADLAEQLINTDQVGFETSRNRIPYVLIEKDFKCLTDRPNEDESDLFTNPNESC